MIETIVASGLLLAAIHFAAMLSPGPTALIVFRYAVRADASLTVVVAGIVCASATNVSLVVAGLWAIILASPVAATVIGVLGSVYLLYLGLASLLTAWRKFNSAYNEGGLDKSISNSAIKINNFMLFRDGFLVNFLNPKIAVFYISIFSQFVEPEMPDYVVMIFATQLVLQSLMFWSMFAAATRAGAIKKALNKTGGWVDFVFGLALIFFATLLLWNGI